MNERFKKKLILVIPLLVLLVLCGGILAFKFINDSKSAENISKLNEENQKYVIASIPRTVMEINGEIVDKENAHVINIDSPENIPSYKYEFLNEGVRILADKKDGKGFIQVVSAVRAIPEFALQEGANGNSVWEKYDLITSTTGKNVAQGYDRQDQKDGTIKLIRNSTASIEGVEEIFTEVWIIPKNVEEFTSRGPKAEYSMTKNKEGAWRMKWESTGISDITADNVDMRDEENWPIRKKEYMNGLFRVDVNDFDNLYDEPMFSYSEYAEGKKAEVIFFKDGTTGDRIIDPTVVTSNITNGWGVGNIRGVFYNGSNYFVFYDKGGTSVYAKGASTVAGLSSAGEQTVINAELSATYRIWNLYMVNDSKFDFVYKITTGVKVRTCTISGTTITCGNASAEFITSAQESISVARTITGNRIWVTGEEVASANQTGDAENIISWTDESDQWSGSTFRNQAIAPYASSDQVIVLHIEDRAGSSNDGFYYSKCLQSDVSCSEPSRRFIALDSPTTNDFGGNLIRISDTDFRYVYVDANSDVIEAKFDGNSTWTTAHATVHTGTAKNPSMFYDRTGNQSYVLYADSNDDIWYHLKTCTSNSGCSESAWGGQTNADNDEADANSLPMTQMHEPSDGSVRTAPREFPWCYLNANGANYDVVCGNANLASTGPDKVAFSNASRTLTKGACNGAASVFTMELQLGSTPTNPNQSTVVRVSSDSSFYTIYSDSSCQNQVNNGDFTFTTAQNSKSVYIIDSGSPGGTKTLTGTRQSGDTLTTGTQNYTLNGPDKVAFSNASRTLNKGACNGAASVFNMELQAGSTPTTPFASTVVRVTSDSSSYTIYSDSSCQNVVSNGDFTFATSENSKNVYIIDSASSGGTKTLTGTRQSGDTLTTGTQNYTLNGPDKVAFSNASRSLYHGACNGAASVFIMEIQAGSTPTNPFASTVVRVTSDSDSYVIYSDNTCATPVSNGDFTFTTGQSSKNVYVIDNGSTGGTKTLTGTRQSGDTLTVGTQNYTLNGPDKVAFSNTPRSIIIGACNGLAYVFTMELQAGSTPTSPFTTTVVRVTSTSGSYVIYSDSGCTSVVNNGDFTFTTGQSAKSVYIIDSGSSGTKTLTGTRQSGDTLTTGTQNYNLYNYSGGQRIQGGVKINGGVNLR